MSDVSGKSVLDLLQQRLDNYVNALQDMEDPDGVYFAEAKGRAHGMAMALAIVLNPYTPELARVKAEALERWQNAHDVPDDPTPEREARMARRRARRAQREARNS